MSFLKHASLSGLFLTLASWSHAFVPSAPQDPPYGRPDAVVDLSTREGADLVKGHWRYSDVKIIEVDAKGPGPDLKPSGAPIRTYDYTPHAGVAGFDDSHWEVID